MAKNETHSNPKISAFQSELEIDNRLEHRPK